MNDSSYFLQLDYFLTLLKNCEFVIGNSSAGIREACIYGIPAIDIGCRQKGRFDLNKIKNLQHVEFDLNAILMAISNSKNYKHLSNEFGCGNSADMFLRILKSDGFWRRSIQKHLTY